MMERRRFLLASGALAVGMATAGTASAKLVRKFAEELKNGEYNWFPERSPGGPIVIVVSIPEQKVHVYRNGIRIAASTCSTGKKGHETPTGVFTILQKDKDHHSATYDGAAMPNMNRLTWDGIALHAGNLPGYPASHGCVRLPLEFSELLFSITQLGMTVILADEKSFPPEIVHPSLMLSDSALGQYRAAETSVLRREYARRQDGREQTTNVIVSSADRSIAVLDNGKEVARGDIRFHGSKTALGDRVYTLAGADYRNGGLRWLKTDLRPGVGAESAPAFDASPRVLSSLRDRVHLGMTILTTDQPVRAASRTAPGFTVISS